MATRKSTTKKVNNWYLKYAEREMLIDEDEQGLFCQVPSECEENKLYDVRVDESMLVPVATSCTCKACEHTTSCKHMTVVNNFYKRIYKSNVAKAQAKAAQVEVVEIVPPVAMELPAELRGYKKTAVSTDTSVLNGAQQSAGLLMALPSRKARAS